MNVRPPGKSFGVDFRQVLIFVCLIYFVAGGAAIFQVPLVGDEPEDFFIAGDTILRAKDFFERIYAPDQARLPHLISVPFIALLGKNALIPLRVLFYLFYFAYVWISYRLLILITENERASFIYSFLIVTSLFLRSFTIFSMTTGSGLFLLFYVASIYFFCKGYLEQRRTGIFFPLTPFLLCLGLCIASKLFGLFLLAALFLYHVWDRSTAGIMVKRELIRRLQLAGLWFIILVFAINFLSFSFWFKSVLSLVVGLTYLGIFLYCMSLERTFIESSKRISKLEFWFTTVLVAFNLTLCFSPIYFNLKNLLWPFDWFQRWNQGEATMFASGYDIPVILILKYGLLSSFILFVSFFVFFFSPGKKQTGDSKRWFFGLIAFIFLVHFLVVSFVHFKGPWYPFAIFPFLYLPFVWMWLKAERGGAKAGIVFMIICLLGVAADNIYRGVKWYPYGHWDGAQYGKRFIGWDKPGYVTFEVVPLIYTALDRSLSSKSYVRVNCQFTPVVRFNHYATSVLRDYFESKKSDHHFYFSTDAGGQDVVDLLLTSPLFHPSFNEKLAQDKQFERLSVIAIKGLEMVSIWRKKA